MTTARIAKVALIAALSTLPAVVEAQWPPESLVNIQALPEDISVREVRTLMRSFNGALGVGCTYCHVGDDPNILREINFISDEKVQKLKAREMIRMVRRINEDLASLPERSDPPVEVTCRTCHHSLSKPADIRDLLTETFNSKGAEAAIERYRDLRERYFGADSYDFRHFILANVAERVADDNPQGAIRLLEFNGELFPDSGQTFFTMSRIYQTIDDTAGAIRSMERALETNPESRFYRRSLERLRSR